MKRRIRTQIEKMRAHWDVLAGLGHSTAYMHDGFVHRDGISHRDFARILSEMGVQLGDRQRRLQCQRRGEPKYEYRGQPITSTQQLADLSPHRLYRSTIEYRLKQGWTVEEAVEKPPIAPSEKARRANKTMRERGMR